MVLEVETIIKKETHAIFLIIISLFSSISHFMFLISLIGRFGMHGAMPTIVGSKMETTFIAVTYSF